MAAYVMSLGGTIQRAADMAGCAERTVRNWRSAPWWRDAQRDAVAKWKGDVLAASKRSVLTIIKDNDPQTTRWALERLMPDDFAPPQRKRDVEFDESEDVNVTIRITGKDA